MMTPSLHKRATCAIIILMTVFCCTTLVAGIVLTDDKGEQVTITAPAERIISLAPSNTEILGALDLMDRVVGVTDYCNYPPQASEKPKIGGFSSVNIEQVVALRPDLVLAAPTNGKETVARLRALGLTVIVVDPQDINGVFDSIRLVGEATGTTDRADILIRSLQKRLNAVQNATAKAPNRPKVAHVVWYDPIWVSGNNTYQDAVIRYAGGMNAFSGVDSWGTVSLEDFLITDPDYILVNAGTGMTNATDNANPVYDYFLQGSRLSQMKAVRENHILLVDTDTISRGGPRIVDPVEQVAHAIHPECFTNVTPVPAGTGEKPQTQTPGFTALLTGCSCILFFSFYRRVKKQ